MVTHAAQLSMPMAELVDLEKERARLEKEKAAAEGEIARAQAKLQNEGFVKKAPEKVVEDVRSALLKNQELLQKINERLESLAK